MKILVTGGAGYKGTVLTRRLLEQGYDVTLMDNFMYGYEPVMHLATDRNLEILKHDIRNGLPDMHRYDVIFHLAGISGFPACASNPHSAQLINVEATRLIARDLSPGQMLINASTTSMYGKSGLPCDEDTALDPVSTYAQTKHAAELILHEKPNVISLRFATVFGFSTRMRMDLMINDFVYKAIKEKVIVLFDSFAKRTFIHVEDAADCYLFAMRNFDTMKGGIFNAGGNSLNFSKEEIAEKIRRKVDFSIVNSDVKDKDLRHFIVNFDKIEKLGYRPVRSVEDGIDELIRIYSFYEYYSPLQDYLTMDKNKKTLAINGGKPVTAEPVLIHKPYLDEDDFAAVDRAMRSTFISGDGPDCREFENELSGYLGAKHVLYVNSATAALELAFRVKNFDPGSEVIIPDFTYTSTALGAIYNNLKIVLADVYPDNGSMDTSQIEKLITSKTVAIAPVDYAGIPADMDAINEIAHKHHLYVVHDTAQSIGSVYKGKKTGTLAEISTFSFHGTKNLTTGEGGAVATDNDKLAERIRVLREKGTDKHSFLTDNRTRGYYEYIDTGNSYVQSNILGALGVTQLKKIEWMNTRRKEIAQYYLDRLGGIDGLDFLRITGGAETNWHIFGILVPPEEKYWVMDALRAEGIMANVHYTPLHRNRFYNSLSDDTEMQGSMRFFSRFLRLPVYPSLTNEERDNVVLAVKKVFNS